MIYNENSTSKYSLIQLYKYLKCLRISVFNRTSVVLPSKCKRKVTFKEHVQKPERLPIQKWESTIQDQIPAYSDAFTYTLSSWE